MREALTLEVNRFDVEGFKNYGHKENASRCCRSSGLGYQKIASANRYYLTMKRRCCGEVTLPMLAFEWACRIANHFLE